LHRLPAPRIHEKTPGPTFDKRTILVRFRPGTSESEQDQSLEEHGLSRAGEIPRIRFVLARIKGDRSAKDARTEMARDGRVEIAQLNYLRHGFAAPNDPAYAAGDQNYLRNIKMPAAWDITHGSTSHSIAILDTGVDLDHPDLSGSRIKPGYDFVNDDSNPQDDNGHGTMVAGIAAAKTNNSMGVAGAAWAAGIIPVKVLNSTGTGTDAQIASGITWASDNGAKVINLSLGGYGESPALENAVDYAVDKGIVVVASAGNDAVDIPTYPAAYDPVLAVSATGIGGGQFAWFSNHGWWIDVSAPGMSIVSTYLASGATESYAIGDGTSFASPIVAGIANLVRYKNPSWTPAKVMSQIQKTARDWGPAGIDPYYGWGWVDGNAALGGTKQPPGTPPARDSFEPNGTLDSAKPITGTLTTPTISPEGDVDWFVKSVTSTGSVTFTVTPPTFDGTRAKEFDPVLEVFGLDMKLLGRVDAGFPGDLETIEVPVSSPGSYYLKVSNYLGSQGSAAYSVTVEESPAVLPPDFHPYETLGVPLGGDDTAIADVTGDGLNDVLWTARFDFENHDLFFVYPQLATGLLGPPDIHTTNPDFTGYKSIGTGDLNDDGLIDAVVAGLTGVEILFQTLGGLGSPQFLPTNSQASEPRVEDINADGRNDLLVRRDGYVFAYLRTATGVQLKAIADDMGSFDVGHMNGDSLLDVVVQTPRYPNPPEIHTYTQGPNFTFTETVTVGPPHLPANLGGPMTVADLTGDGLDDVAIANSANSPNSLVDVLPQLPSGGYGPATTYTVYETPNDLATTDIDGDGLTDLVVGHSFANVGLMLQGPDEGLRDELLFPVPNSIRGSSIAIGDINADEALDLTLADFNEGLIVLRQIAPGRPVPIRNNTPADFATGVSRTVDPIVNFGRSIDPASITSATVYVKNGNTWSTLGAGRSYNASTKTLTIDLSGTRSANAPFVVFVDGVKDTDGNVMPLYTFRFTTGS
jgi:type VII secretion-associated serine protease mycosin